MKYFSTPAKADFDARKLMISYPKVYFDREEYADWFRETTKQKPYTYFRILVLYMEYVHVLVYFIDQFKARSAKRFRYKGTVPEVRVIQDGDWTPCIVEFDRVDPGKPQDIVQLPKDNRECLSAMNKLPWIPELRKELYDPCSPSDRLVWYENVDDQSNEFGSKFFSFLHEISPWQFLHVKIEESYHDIYDCIDEVCKTRPQWTGYCLLLDLRYHDSALGVHSLLLHEKRNSTNMRIYILARYSPLLKDEECDKMDVRSINMNNGTMLRMKSSWQVAIPDSASPVKKSAEQVWKEFEKRQKMAQMLTINKQPEYNVCEHCGQRHPKADLIEQLYDDGRSLTFFI